MAYCPKPGNMCLVKNFYQFTMLFFLSHLVYGCQIWGQRNNIFTKKVLKLQDRALRILYFADFHANADPVYKMFNILKLNDIIALQNCIFVQDFFNNKLPIYFNSYFQSISDIHSINTKSSELGCIHIHFFATTNKVWT